MGLEKDEGEPVHGYTVQSFLPGPPREDVYNHRHCPLAHSLLNISTSLSSPCYCIERYRENTQGSGGGELKEGVRQQGNCL